VKYVDEFRDAEAVGIVAKAIRKAVTRPWAIMEICGGQTHSIVKFGIDELLPKGITLIHGPGCPVCVTPLEYIDRAIAIAARPDTIFCSFGDMVRVPGSGKDLLTAKAEGADVRIVYSPLDAVEIARQNPSKRVVFFAVGFETTAPATAMAVYQARMAGVKNFSLLVTHVLVPPAMRLILRSPNVKIQGFLAAGHVCTVMGYGQYESIAKEFRVPIVVTGFEPFDILQGILLCVQQLEAETCEVQNAYTRVVRHDGNVLAQDLVGQVFVPVDRQWRGIGLIPQSGLALSEGYREFDAERIFDVGHITASESPLCISGEVMQGIKRPMDCPAFGKECTPQHPLGAPMVSSEGACAAYFQYRKGGGR
jgi:hydrogenase expression/formation protein HypD